MTPGFSLEDINRIEEQKYGIDIENNIDDM
jgi:hypothetical protein